MMKKYIINNIKFLFLFLGLLFFGLLLPNNNSPRSIDYSLLKKHELLDSIQKPKIILTGGSNVLFGFNSKTISDSLKMPVVNHAIHAGYGLKYILDDISQFIKKGDIIILSPEYSHFLGNKMYGSEPLLFSLTVKPENIKLLSFKQIINTAQYIPKFSFNRMKSYVISQIKTPIDTNDSNIYGEFAINKHGDNFKHWDKEKQEFTPYIFNYQYNESVLVLIKKFMLEINKLGAKLYISFPSLCNSSYNLNEEIILKIEKSINSEKINTLGTPSDFKFNDNYFFDTPYHLNGKGVKIRTELFIKMLKLKIYD